MKKFTVVSLALVLALMMALTAFPAFAAGETVVSMTADRTTAKAGEIVTYTVAIGPVENLGTLRIQLPTDSQLAAENKLFYVPGSAKVAENLKTALDAHTLEYAEDSRILLISTKNGFTSTENTTLLSFQMMVADDATGEAKAALNLADGDICAVDNSLLAHTMQDAVVTVDGSAVPTPVPGVPTAAPVQPTLVPQPSSAPVDPVQPVAPVQTPAPGAQMHASPTGDTTNMTLWIVVAVAALAVLAGGGYYYYNQKKKK